jgi:hypothetical protein
MIVRGFFAWRGMSEGEGERARDGGGVEKRKQRAESRKQ